MKRTRRQKNQLRGLALVAPTAPEDSPRTRWIRWLQVATVALLSVAALMNLYAWVRIWFYPADANFGEGVVLYEAQRIAQGLPIYKAASEPPYWFSTYPPLYQYLASLLNPASFFWARFVSIISSCWCAAALGLVVWRSGRERLAAMLAPALWLTSSFVVSWSALARVDMLGRALETAAVLCVWMMWRRPAGRLTCGVVFASLAMLTKQTMVAGGLTCALVLWFESRRLGATFVAAWVVVTSACYFVLNALTGGYFWQNVFTNTARGFDIAILLYWVVGFAEEHWGLVIACVLCGIEWASARRRDKSVSGGPETAPADRNALGMFAAAAVAGVPGTLLAGNDGVDVNYFLDLAWALCGLVACMLGTPRPVGAESGNARIPKLAAAAWISIAAYALVMVLAPIEGPTGKQYAVARQLQQRLAEERKPLLTEFVGYGLFAGSTPDYLPYMYKKLEEAGTWKPDPIVDNIRQKRYGVVLISTAAKGRFSATIMSAIEQNYRLANAYEGTFIVEGQMVQLYFVPK